MDIKLSDRNIPCSRAEQAAKVIEEWQEFQLAQVCECNIDRVAEEAFDLMEALVRWMTKTGIDVPEANRLHLEKMRLREQAQKA